MKIFLLVVWLILLPLGIGMPITLQRERDTLGVKAMQSFLTGYFVVLGIFQILSTIAVLLHLTMTQLTMVSICVYVPLAFFGYGVYFMKLIRPGRALFEDRREGLKGFSACFYVLAVLLMIAQIAAGFYYETPNADDAYYLAEALEAYEKDTLYTLDPYSGYPMEFDVRHSLSGFPLFYSFLGRISGVHPTIIAHTVWPPVVILLAYITQLLIGMTLVSREYASLYLFLIGLLNLFGNTSRFATENYLLTRTWQGKAMLSGLVIPAIFWVFLYYLSKFDTRYRQRESIYYDSGKTAYRREYVTGIITLSLITLTGLFASTMSLFLLTVLVGILVVLLAVYFKKPLMILNIVFLPALIILAYAVLYVFLR